MDGSVEEVEMYILGDDGSMHLFPETEHYKSTLSRRTFILIEVQDLKNEKKEAMKPSELKKEEVLTNFPDSICNSLGYLLCKCI
jgi:hypothetical protein